MWKIENLRRVGFYDYKQTLAKVNYRLTKHSLYERFPLEYRSAWDRVPNKYAVVQGTIENMAVQILKFDAPVKRDFMTTLCFRRTVSLVEKMYEAALTTSPTDWFDCFSQFEMDKSPGVPWTGAGFRTKAQVYEYPEEFVDYALAAVEQDVPVVFGTVPKTEFLPVEEIAANKVRIFSPGPFHFLLIQSHLYSKQNVNLKNFNWSGYGYNLYRGGCERLRKSGVGASFFFDMDLPRCDKSFLLMSTVYEMRNKFLKLPTDFQHKMADWVKRRLEVCWVVLPDGTVVESDRINPSGQLNTTTDNILYVSLIVSYLLMLADPTADDATIMRQFVKIFGDDVIGGLEERFMKMRNRAWVVEQFEVCFGLKLTSYNVHNTFEGVHWLGADFYPLYGDGPMVPHYPTDRLLDSWRFTENPKLADWQILCKLRSILILSFPHKHLFTQFRDCYLAVLVTCASSKDARVVALVRLGVPSSIELEGFYTGFEHSSLHGLEFFTVQLEVGGVKSVCMNAGGKTQSVKATRTGESLAQKIESVSQANPAKFYSQGAGTGKGSHRPSPKGKAVGERTLKLAKAVQGGHKNRVKLALGSSSGGTSGTDPGVAGGGGRHPIGVGSHNSGRFVSTTGLNKKINVITYRKPGGKIIATGVKQNGGPPLKMLAGPPVAQGSQYYGSALNERDHIDPKYGRMVQIVGHQLLSEVRVAGDSAAIGERLAMILMMPDALGGRLLLLAQQFEQHKVNHLRVRYVPSVPSTTDGAIAVYFRNDVATPTLDIGIDELTHAATHPSYVQSQVWEHCSVDINPSDALRKYFDEESGDFRLEVQGLVTILAASALDAQVFGNLYLEYDIDFYGEELDYEIPDIATPELSFAWVTHDQAAEELMPLVFPSIAGAPGAGLLGVIFDNPLDNTNYVIYGVATVESGVSLTWCTLADPTPRAFETGQGMFFRMANTAPGTTNFSDGTIYLIAFADLASASADLNFEPNIVTNPGQIVFSGTGGVVTGGIQFQCRTFELSLST